MAKSPKRPNPNAETRIVLTPREFQDLHGVCAIATVALLTIKQQADAAITAAQAPQREALARLARKYQKAGMRPDRNYRFDPADHALVEVAP